MMKALKRFVLVAAATLAMASAARADDATERIRPRFKPLVFVFNVGANTEYELRRRLVSQPTTRAASSRASTRRSREWLRRASGSPNVASLKGHEDGKIRILAAFARGGPGHVDSGHPLRLNQQALRHARGLTEWKVAPRCGWPGPVGIDYFY